MEAIKTRYAVNGNGSSNGKATNPTKDIGNTGLQEFSGRIQDDFLPDWRTTQDKVKRVEQMLKNSPLIGGALRLAVEMSLRGCDWYPTSENGDEDPDLELVNEALGNLSHSWNDHIADSCLMPFYGWTMYTVMYERVDGRLLWRKFKMLGHDTVSHWYFDSDGGLLGVQQWPHLWLEPIPIERMLIYRFRNNRNNPEGESILRPAWIPYYYSSNLQEIRAIGYERHAAGLPKVKMPMGANPDTNGTDYKQADKIGRNIRVDEQGAVIIPPPTGAEEYQRWDVEFMSAGNAQVFMALDSTIAQYDTRQLMAAMAQFLILGMDRVGTQSKAETDVGFFTMAINAVADIIAETFTKYAINRLLELNGRTPGAIKLEHSPAGDVNMTEVIELVKAISLKVTHTPEDEVWLRSLANMPEKTVEEIEEAQEEAFARQQEIMRQQQATRPPFGNRPPGGEPPNDERQQQEREENAAKLRAAIERYAADGAPPDERKRIQQEKELTKRVADYFEGAKRRVISGVKEL